jgi:hypothetical protein
MTMLTSNIILYRKDSSGHCVEISVSHILLIIVNNYWADSDAGSSHG